MSTLKQARIDANLSVEEVSHQLNIRKHYIIAIEENRFDDIPSGVYAQGYIKMYSKFLGVELKPVVNTQQNESYSSVVEFGAKNNLGMATAMIFVLVLAAWIYMITLPSVDNKGLIENLENIEPANYMLNIQKPENATNDLMKVDLKLPNIEEIRDGFNEPNNQ
jgi:hypothetical protein